MKRIIKTLSRGFTLIELIVVIAIFALITSIALFNQGKLNSTLLVTNLAYEVALAVRESQTYGVGVRSDGTSGNFEGGYGISFDITRPTEILFFTDKDKNHLADAGEIVSRLIIQNQRGNKIVALCRGTAGTTCSSVGGSPHQVGILNIIFRRPNPEAIFLSYPVGGGSESDNAEGPAYIVVNTPEGDNCRVVVVEQTGQISVNNAASGLCSN